ncbi:MAG: ABC-F family ATP-binding cassette domain-containing protein [Bacteroidales bacterium]|nr:ABC-F family ATP-binding cassette domain-containing protein [Bacteroidales bacterium]MCF8458799.1 ABC-F family ATP-binding cassette domain-containing protein [Bacteroidales bacterium]
MLLFGDVSFGINKDQKIALIAKNGAGKTSLLDIIAGIETPDSGAISMRNGISISFLKQEPEFDEENTVFGQVFESSKEIIKVIREYEEVIHLHDKKRLEEVMHKMEILNAWDYEVKVKQILTQLNVEEFDKKIKYLSGGQRKRLALANALINEPDLLILDEPTNHLDMEMIEWLEQFLKNANCTLFMVTHDRYFLDRVCNEIIELDDNQIFNYKGNYSYFLEKRDQRIQNLNASIEKARNLMRKELDWMRRMPQARTTKSKTRVDAFYDLQDTASQKTKEKKINMNIKGSRLGKKILELTYISKAFDGKNLIKDFSYKFTQGEKIGIIGRNGCGKSTFLNIITQQLKPDSGKIDLGETVSYGYYKQEGINFKEGQRLIDVVKEVAEVVIVGDGHKMSVAQFLNYFLFPNETHNQQISKLSGGEKRRLYLLTVLMKNPNFLILDEPTNDLDIMTLNVLEEYLQKFAGCVIIVSHDRYFMDKVVDHLFVFKENGQMKDFPGNYSQYLDHKNLEEKAAKRIQKKEPAKTKPTPNKHQEKISFKDKREYELLDRELENLNTEKAGLESEIVSGNLKQDELLEKSNRLAKVMQLIDEKEIRWLELDELI